ncbi:hypothetical protein F5Y09DRAFT_341694 [Xylaria sp. FL1042]|nr:hypothetical protein F5Y09DRAFT_341694 [Xylaria sp. FL1042]
MSITKHPFVGEVSFRTLLLVSNLPSRELASLPYDQDSPWQNHGYAVDASTLPSDWAEYFVNLNDGGNEGMRHTTRPIFSTQFHPGARGGPMGSAYLFDKYIEDVQAFKSCQAVFKDNRPLQFMLDILNKERVGVAARAFGCFCLILWLILALG